MVATEATSWISYSNDRCGDFRVLFRWRLVGSGVEFNRAMLELVQHHHPDLELSGLYRAAAQAKGRAPPQRSACRRLLQWRTSVAFDPGYFDGWTSDRGAAVG